MEGEGGGGLADVFWCGAAVRNQIREETKATCRAIPLSNDAVAGGVSSAARAPERAFSPRLTERERGRGGDRICS